MYFSFSSALGPYRRVSFLGLFLLTLSGFFPIQARAGFIEIGASANVRYSIFDANNFVQSMMYTGSFSYYFWEMCAWELNYTTGYSKQVSQIANGPKYTIEDTIQLTSLDLVLSFASRQDPFRPYIKFGAGYIVKERFREVDEDGRMRLPTAQQGVVPSAGIGLAMNLTKQLSFKLGVDAWTSPLQQNPVVIDYAGRAGLAWLF